MYTKCPSCRSEISFEPPANMADLPDGYKHKIKCPSCGVTIGVKIPKQESAVTSFTPQNEFAVTPETPIPVGTAVEPKEEEKSKKKKKEKVAAEKKSGAIRNIFMLVFSALLIAINVIAYLGVSIPFCGGFERFNGIGVIAEAIKDFEAFKGLFAVNFLNGITTILPAIALIFIAIDFLVALIALFGKKYGRVFNLIFAIGIGYGIVGIALYPDLLTISLKAYLATILETQAYGIFIAVGIAVLQFICSLIFLKSMKKKK